MRKGAKLAVLLLAVIILVGGLATGCGGNGEEGKTTIVFGHLTDLTGVASTNLSTISLALDANVRYINEENPIPGVEIKVVRWDTMYDTSRAIPGYYWLKDHGADVIYTEMPEMAEPLVPFVEKDKTVVVCHPGTAVLANALSWVFCINPTSSSQMRSMMKYIGDNWDYSSMQRRPKIGTAGWSTPYGNDVKLGAEYCLDYPDKYDYVGSYMAPAGTVTWSGEVEKLKGCDYIVLTTPGALQPATFAAEYVARGYSTTWLGLDSLCAFWDFMVESVGSKNIEGSLIGQWLPLAVYKTPVVDHLIELAHKYYPDDADRLIYANNGFVGGGSGTYYILECLRACIEEVGPENFDGQAFFNTAIKWRPHWEGYPEDVGWSQDDRLSSRWQMIYEWSDNIDNFEVLSDWLEVIGK